MRRRCDGGLSPGLRPARPAATSAGLGRQILDRAFEPAGKSFSEEKRGALQRLARASTEDVFAAVGRGEMFSGEVVKAVYPDFKDERRYGGAMPGDPIVGILTPGVGVTIYPIQSAALAAFDNEPERWLDLRWDVEDSNERFTARIALESMNEPGTLAQIAQVIAEHDGNIDNVSMKRRTQDFTDIAIDLSVPDLKHLTAIVADLRGKRSVSRVERING